jgi:2'-5' RNA ligase
MNYFLGFFPDENANYKIRKVVGEVGRIFKDFDIPVRWVQPETFHISLYYLGDSLNFIQKYFLKKKLKRIDVIPFTIRLGRVRLGISRKYKELVYIDLEDGGEEIRRLYHSIEKSIKNFDSSTFVPHLTIGRVSKDLSEEEYRNLVRDIQNISKSLSVKDISFKVTEVYLIKSKDGIYTPLIKFEAK